MSGLNHDFYEQVRQEHEELREWLGRVHNALTQRMESASRIGEMFEALAQHLDQHFQDEEQGGFFEQVVATAPRYADRTTALQTEHAQLRNSLEQLAARVRDGEGTDAWWQELHDGFHEFSKSLMQHENKENELLQDAFDEDVGSKD